jgi:tetratricopeptide (TPR) repeat protein
MLPSPQPLLRALIRAGAWEATQQVLDANAEPEEAQQLLEETGQIDSASAAALGRAWAQGGSPEVALALLEWTVEQGRDDPFLFGLIGQLHRQAGRWAQARAAFEEALRHDHTKRCDEDA